MNGPVIGKHCFHGVITNCCIEILAVKPLDVSADDNITRDFLDLLCGFTDVNIKKEY